MEQVFAARPTTVDCTVCSEHAPHGVYFVFDELAGEPRLCARCVFKALTGQHLDWHPALVSRPTTPPNQR